MENEFQQVKKNLANEPSAPAACKISQMASAVQCSGQHKIWNCRKMSIFSESRSPGPIGTIRQWPGPWGIYLCHTFCTLSYLKKSRSFENRTLMLELHAKGVRFSHGRVFFDSHNVQKRATKSDTSGHCLWPKDTKFWLGSNYQFTCASLNYSLVFN